MGLILKTLLKLKINPRSSDLEEDCALADPHTQISNGFVPYTFTTRGQPLAICAAHPFTWFPGIALGQSHKILRAIQRNFYLTVLCSFLQICWYVKLILPKWISNNVLLHGKERLRAWMDREREFVCDASRETWEDLSWKRATVCF